MIVVDDRSATLSTALAGRKNPKKSSRSCSVNPWYMLSGTVSLVAEWMGSRSKESNGLLLDVKVTRSDEQAVQPTVVYRRTMIVTAAIFMGYASLVTLQHRLKVEHDKVDHPADDVTFTYASQLNYLGNLIFRLAHNFIFAFLTPRQRVFLSLACMGLAMGTLAVAICMLRDPWIGWVPIAYLLGGVAVGTHESNLLASITPLGHATKKWAILGLPTGFTFISVGGFLLLQLGVPLYALYLLTTLACAVAAAVFATIPVDGVGNAPTATAAAVAPSEVGHGHSAQGGGHGNGNASSNGHGHGIGTSTEPGESAFSWALGRKAKAALPAPSLLPPLPPPTHFRGHFERFRSDLSLWRSWLPHILPHSIALLLNMYAVSFMTAIMLYILNDSHPGGQVCKAAETPRAPSCHVTPSCHAAFKRRAAHPPSRDPPLERAAIPALLPRTAPPCLPLHIFTGGATRPQHDVAARAARQLLRRVQPLHLPRRQCALPSSPPGVPTLIQASLGGSTAEEASLPTAEGDRDPRACPPLSGLSRQHVYARDRLIAPFYFLAGSLAGVWLGLAKIPLLAPLGLFCVFYANGSIYATSTKHIDSKVDRAFNLTALSIWLFIGDFGSVLGSNTWQRVAPLVCEGVDAPHMCLPD